MKNKVLIFTFLFVGLFSFAQKKAFNTTLEKEKVAQLLDRLNELASQADFKNYFDLYAEESVFIGTDATEVWNKEQFMDYAKPHFARGRGWNFKSLQRNIYFSKDGTIAWFDEILDTQMKICRGSGVLEKQGKQWKIRQYVLSSAIPNDVADQVIKLKAPIEDKFLEVLKAKNLK